MNFADIHIPGEVITVEGEKKANEIIMLTLSTCQWCKKGKQWLKDNNYTYSYLDIDKVPLEEKREFKRAVSKHFNVMVRFPFLIVDGNKFYVGYNIENWKEMLFE